MRKISVLTSFLLAGILFLSCSGNAKVEPEAESKAPAAPTGLNLHGDPGETSLSFQWTAVDGAKGYNWKIAKGTTEVNAGKTTRRNQTVEGLEKGTTYKFSVQSVADGQTSAWVSVEAKTAGESDTPDTPDDPDGPDGPDDPDPNAYAQFLIPEVEEDGLARAFPGAEGGGMWTTGGRGGRVIHVTNLNDSGEGSLRWAVNQSGPRTVVFDVAGTIALQSQLQIKNGDLTIAGQTAPGDGICIKNYTFRIHTDNVIVRFIRCRMGDEKQTEDDAIQIQEKYGDAFSNIIIDHCSVSWCTDECASFYGMKNFTFSWNIVSESLRNSIHDKGPHGYGGIWGGTDASYHHNLLAHHDSRNPRIDHDYVSHQKGPVSIFNNVVYNWEGNTCYGGESSSKNGSDYRKYNFFNNYYKPGPVTPSNNHRWLLQPTTSCSNCGGTIIPGHFYMDGNILEGQSAVNSNNWTAGTKSPTGVYYNASKISEIKESSPFTGDYSQSIHSAQNAFDKVLAYAGASYARDRIDVRIAKETKEGTYTYQGSNLNPTKTDSNGNKISVERSYKGLIDTQTDVQEDWWQNGWPVYSDNGETITDSDKDGMPDEFEKSFGLNPSQDDSSKYDLDSQKRYTNLEMYLHYLVKDIVAAQNKNASYTKL